MAYNLSKYTRNSVGFASTSAFPGSTGTASLSDTFGFPFETTGFDNAGFDGIQATAAVTNSTGLTIAAYTNSGSAGGAIATAWTAVVGGTISYSTATAGYSTVAFGLTLDVVKPRNRNIAFISSVPTTSAVLLAVTVTQYGARIDPPAAGINSNGSTVAVSLSS